MHKQSCCSACHESTGKRVAGFAHASQEGYFQGSFGILDVTDVTQTETSLELGGRGGLFCTSR